MKHFLYICFLILVILFFSYKNSVNSVENFTPKIRQIYRPMIRNTRLISEGFYSNVSSNISNILRKLQII
jgi:hypothetical protein